MSYNEQPFTKRLSTMGDEAEHMFEVIGPVGKVARLGWNRPPVSMSQMTEMIRHVPDYYAQIGRLVECMGLGRDGIIKLKLVKFDALTAWNKIQPVSLFLWNSSMSEWVLLEWRQVQALVRKSKKEHGVQVFKNDGNEYWGIDREWIDGWLPYE